MEEERERELLAKATAWLNEKWTTDKSCPVCSTDKWSIAGLVELRPFEGGSLVVGGNVYPGFQVVCTNCGHTLLFNAIVAELFPAGQPQEVTPEEQASSET